jgi:hypothetical protein
MARHRWARLTSFDDDDDDDDELFALQDIKTCSEGLILGTVFLNCHAGPYIEFGFTNCRAGPYIRLPINWASTRALIVDLAFGLSALLVNSS